MSRTWELFALTHLPEKKKTCTESPLSIVQVESEQWTIHSPHQTQLEIKNTAPLTHKKRRAFTLRCDFSLVA